MTDTGTGKRATENVDARETQTEWLSPALVSLAQRVLREYEGWQRDRDEPPSLREGFIHPGQYAITMAEAIVAEADRV